MDVLSYCHSMTITYMLLPVTNHVHALSVGANSRYMVNLIPLIRSPRGNDSSTKSYVLDER